jgi:hypothetical protein
MRTASIKREIEVSAYEERRKQGKKDDLIYSTEQY